MKTNNIIKLALATLVSFFISFIIAKASGKGSYPEALIQRYAEGFKCAPEQAGTGTDSGVTRTNEVRKVEAKNIHEVELNVISANVQVQISESDLIELKGSSPGSLSIAQSIDGETLRFTENKVGGSSSSKSAFSFNCIPDLAHGISINMDGGDQSKYILSIPKGVKGVHLHAVSGDIHVDPVALETLRIETTSGDVQADASKVRKLKIKSVSGDLKLDLAEKKQESEIESVSGDVSLSAKKTLNAKLQMKTVSGDIDFGEKHEHEDEEVVGHVFTKTFGKGDGLIDVKTISGDLHVGFE